MSEDRLSIVCPVYNEADNIGATLDRIEEQVSIPAELVIVYDFDGDTTVPVVRARADGFKFPVRLEKNRYGRGALNAVKTGLQSSTASLAIVVIMADLADDLRTIDPMFERIRQGDDVVCGSRYMPGGRQIGGPWLKSTLSRTAGLSLYFLAGVPTHDATNNFKMYRGSFIAQTPVESQAGFEIGLELAVKAYTGGFKVSELPTTWTDRVAGESRFNLRKWLPHYLRWYRYAFAHRFLGSASPVSPPKGTA